ncbi:MAG: hypothetical protein C0614_01130, partial [Desulfuromonas sp.]
MKRLLTLTLALFSLISTSNAFAYPDQYMGDAAIYEGLPQDIGRPNIMFIIDNSLATLQTVSTAEYNSAVVYPVGLSKTGADCATIGDGPASECWMPYNIYKQDNQGDFAFTVIADADSSGADLNEMTCDPDGTDYIRKFFQYYGSYSGGGEDVSATPPGKFPNLDGAGACDAGPKGEVYAIGNYLNYLKNTEDVGTVDTGTCPAPDIVTVSVNRNIIGCIAYKPNGTCRTYGDVNVTRDEYYQALQTHVSTTADHPVTGVDTSSYWTLVGVPNDNGTYSLPDGATSTGYWSVGTSYDRDSCNDGGGGGAVGVTTMTQREVMYSTLEDVIGSTATIVNFGAMVYGSNNSGADLIAGVDNLSEGLSSVPAGTYDVVVAPDCSDAANASVPYCIFFNSIPGPDRNGDGDFNDAATDGASTLASNTLRPQAESVYDAGYYFGAGRTGEADATTYSPITNNTQIDPADSPCDMNHIILITNGFSNGDGSPNMSFIGDADGDGRPDESVYGLGSHWLDDVARYLDANNKITTHTVLAFQSYDALVANAAKDGNGQFHLASNSAQLRKALLEIIASIINEVSTSFVAPVVPASTTNRTISSNRV